MTMHCAFAMFPVCYAHNSRCPITCTENREEARATVRHDLLMTLLVLAHNLLMHRRSIMPRLGTDGHSNNNTHINDVIQQIHIGEEYFRKVAFISLFTTCDL